MKDGHKVEWDAAMSWWRSQPLPIQLLIRRLATDKLIAEGAEEVGSSDVNHSVFSMHRELKASGYDNAVTFLIEHDYHLN